MNKIHNLTRKKNPWNKFNLTKKKCERNLNIVCYTIISISLFDYHVVCCVGRKKQNNKVGKFREIKFEVKASHFKLFCF